MSEFIEEYKNTFTEDFCDDLIEQIQEEDPPLTEVPKNDESFLKKIEHHLYKNTLLCIADYKKKRIKNLVKETDHPIYKEVMEGFQQKLKIDSFKIIQNTQKVAHYERSISRYNLMTFVIYLNQVENGKLVFGEQRSPEGTKLFDETLETTKESEEFGNKTVEPEAGKLVLFPETPELPYYGESPKEGEIQYIITGQISIIEP